MPPIDSPVATEFVPSPLGRTWDRRDAPVKAIVVHMAEGGGTVEHLDDLDGNSSHYVVRKTGTVVQMVEEEVAAGSMKPARTRTGNDAPYTFGGARIVYGRTALNASGIAADPNRYAIAIEVEGFAANGPNDDQAAVLKRLIADIRRRHGSELHLLGHRDQQDYKACPGHKIPWADLGGHGAFKEDPGVAQKPITSTNPALISWPDGTPYFELDGTTKIGMASKNDGEYSPYAVGTLRAFFRGGSPRQLALIKPTLIKPVPASGAAAPDASALAQATKAGRRAMKAEAVAALSALSD